MISITNLLSVGPSKADGKTVPKTELLVDGRSTGKFVAGAHQEIALRCKDGYVLVLNDDCPHEEGLHIHYLDHELLELDYRQIFAMYCTGLFANFEITGPMQFRFSFFNEDDRFAVTLLERKNLASPGQFLSLLLLGKARLTKRMNVKLERSS